MAQNTDIIKNKIENEIKEINIRYEKVEKEISKSFELQTEDTTIKSKLEEYLTLVNELIRNYEGINKGIKALNKEEKEQENKKIRK